MGCTAGRCAFYDAMNLRACLHRGCAANRCREPMQLAEVILHHLRMPRGS